jgi:hypothetical protein
MEFSCTLVRKLSQHDEDLVSAWGVRDEISIKGHSVQGKGLHAGAHARRVLDGDFVEGTTEAATDGVLLPVGTDAWID